MVMIDGDHTHLLEKNKLEYILPPILRTLYDDGMRDMRVIQWPGSFFNIRVGALLLNTLQSLTPETITFYTIHKEALLQRLYEKWYTPRYSAVFIGQRKNARRYDHQEHSYETLPYKTITSQAPSYLIDQTQQLFLDGEQIQYQQKDGPYVQRKWQMIDITQASWIVSEVIIPHYGIQPLTQ